MATTSKNFFVKINNRWTLGTFYVKADNEWKMGTPSIILHTNKTNFAVVENYGSNESYGFKPIGNNWYESTNQYLNNSVSICKITITINSPAEVKLNYIIEGEGKYDCGYISKNILNEDYEQVDEEKNKSIHVFDGDDGEGQITLGSLSAGSHTYYIKYKKDYSVSNEIDTLRFQLVGIPTSGEEDYEPPECTSNCPCDGDYGCDYDCGCDGDCGYDCPCDYDCRCDYDCGCDGDCGYDCGCDGDCGCDSYYDCGCDGHYDCPCDIDCECDVYYECECDVYYECECDGHYDCEDCEWDCPCGLIDEGCVCDGECDCDGNCDWDCPCDTEECGSDCSCDEDCSSDCWLKG